MRTLHAQNHTYTLFKQKQKPHVLYTHNTALYGTGSEQLVQQTLKTSKVRGATGQNTVLSAAHNAGTTPNYVQLLKHAIMSVYGNPAYVYAVFQFSL